MSNLICDTQYLFWVWFALARVCILIVLAGMLGMGLVRDWKQLTRIERGLDPEQL